jgi:hypothetical protein
MDLSIDPSRLSTTSKTVLGVLLLVNFTVALYLIFAEPSSVREGGQQTAAPTKQPLKLIDELDPSERVPRVVEEERAFSPQVVEALACRAWGPFANTEVLAPVQALVLEADPAARLVSFEIEAAPDFLVYLNSDNNLDNARRILQELESQGIEAYVIAGGEYVNSVSAGVFSNQESATGLVERLRDLGYSPELQALERAQQVTYLMGRVPAGFRAGNAESVACDTIAQLQEFL